VKGKLQFFTTAHVYSGGVVYEFNYPGIALTSPAPQAKVVHHWGDVYSGEKWVGNNGGSSGIDGGVPTYGLYYDEERERLYWSYGHWYNATHPGNPSFGYSTLNDSTGVAKGVGAWALADRPEKYSRGGVLRIPQWFANRYTDGKSLGVGFGGYFSIISSASVGPSLAAVDDPDIHKNPTRSALANVPLIGYPFGAPDRGHRDPDYTSFYENGVYPTKPGPWNPSGKTGYWTSSDIISGGAVWINLPDKHGILFIGKIGQGNVWYEKSERHAERGRYEWFVYDPKDLIEVASREKEQWQVQPKVEWTDSTLPLAKQDRTGWNGDGVGQVNGVTFDARTDRLYVLASGAWKGEVELYPMVYVYRVR
jgi:hypothetical protein